MSEARQKEGRVCNSAVPFLSSFLFGNEKKGHYEVTDVFLSISQTRAPLNSTGTCVAVIST